ncbi:hypothetical protein IAQ67_15155 [Paenibacillus peoriae]|uniref:Uncharacterized protein n=1 Tax=Paenibacillus peoriae TaxID=59893 RepID=A0A7H0Y2E2_9BACL|nr:hypothetical protein [Paenibacillus peoriae]QNR65250.1 hypothetical protein IAQ67_15155 [Paenibacillus peoriae]
MQKSLTPLIPAKIGLSAKDVIYLIVFRELQNGPKYIRELFDSVITESVNLKSKSYIYQAVQDMDSKGWISCIETRGMKRIMAITESGTKKHEDFTNTYLNLLRHLKGAADYFAYIITGSGRKEQPIWDEGVLKHFNRLISVRHLARFLFLSILNDPEHNSGTVVNIYELMAKRYSWQCGEGYMYDLAHEMEDHSNGWVEGRWNSIRRHHYIYRLTDLGVLMISKEGESALNYIRNLQHYTRSLLRLFPNLNEK